MPRGHEEVARLEAEAAATGGLQEGMSVRLANGQQALVRKLTEQTVVIDANHPLAGAPLQVQLRVMAVEPGEPEAAAAA